MNNKLFNTVVKVDGTMEFCILSKQYPKNQIFYNFRTTTPLTKYININVQIIRGGKVVSEVFQNKHISRDYLIQQKYIYQTMFTRRSRSNLLEESVKVALAPKLEWRATLDVMQHLGHYIKPKYTYNQAHREALLQSPRMHSNKFHIFLPDHKANFNTIFEILTTLEFSQSEFIADAIILGYEVPPTSNNPNIFKYKNIIEIDLDHCIPMLFRFHTGQKYCDLALKFKPTIIDGKIFAGCDIKSGRVSSTGKVQLFAPHLNLDKNGFDGVLNEKLSLTEYFDTRETEQLDAIERFFGQTNNNVTTLLQSVRSKPKDMKNIDEANNLYSHVLQMPNNKLKPTFVLPQVAQYPDVNPYLSAQAEKCIGLTMNNYRERAVVTHILLKNDIPEAFDNFHFWCPTFPLPLQ